MEDRLKEIEVKIAHIEDTASDSTKRIDELQTITKAFYELAADVKVMVNEMTNMKSDINDIKIKVDNHVEEPVKIAFNLKTATLTSIISAIVGATIALILK